MNEAVMNEAGSGAPVLRARGLRKHYGDAGLVRAVDGVDLDVEAAETVAVMGPSGCGKSTLLHLLGGLDRACAGEISLAGRRVDQPGERALARLRREVVGFVFQALGATPRQVSAGIAAAQVIPAVPGALLGVPLGIELFTVTSHAGRVTVPPAWWLAAAVLGTVLAVAALASVPALAGTRRPAAEILQAETA